MRSEKFYTSIGMFVVGAFILMTMAAVFFYQEFIHARSQMYVMFFKGSLKGLNSTTPVTYRGVKIGEVKLIEITENKTMNKVRIPVYVQFFVEKNLGFTQNPIHLLIDNGYVAQVSTPNFITGNAEIELVKMDTYTPANDIFFNGYPVFPTRSRVEKSTTLDDSIKSAKLSFDAFKTLITSKEVSDLIQSIQAMSNNMSLLAMRMDRNLPPAMTYFSLTMQKIADAASSTQNLTDYLSRNPESLLRGKR
ncbi:MlaD family protein [Legionella worsleiensis]|uniref:Putative transmembrane protein n=1 Tax=Legionella worsleiensis TaxID=45076 RepID=A0A0W1AJD0_9GAMM|nr:MlaD family protein [Legionella worsleiensis]KTD81495.1 putative transmembrane protein [Legionella worsleiensis]STY32054.1 putative transmembrane protein [Legionella worsleiensis]